MFFLSLETGASFSFRRELVISFSSLKLVLDASFWRRLIYGDVESTNSCCVG